MKTNGKRKMKMKSVNIEKFDRKIEGGKGQNGQAVRRFFNFYSF